MEQGRVWCWLINVWMEGGLAPCKAAGALCSFPAGASSAPFPAYLGAGTAPQPQVPAEALPAWLPAFPHLQPLWSCSALVLTNPGGAHGCFVNPLCIGTQRPSCTKSENAGSLNDPKYFSQWLDWVLGVSLFYFVLFWFFLFADLFVLFCFGFGLVLA